MARNAGKPRLVAFKVEEELAGFLDALPNKSEFIRRAVLAQFGMACPLCTGPGVVPRGIGEHYAEVIQTHSQRSCAGCGRSEVIPRTAEGVADEDRPRVEQFLHGGPLYCRKCYSKSPACGVCGWHLPVDQFEDHGKEHHSES